VSVNRWARGPSSTGNGFVAASSTLSKVQNLQAGTTILDTSLWSSETNVSSVVVTIKAAPGTFAGFLAFNNSAGTLYFQVFNKASDPVGGDAAVHSVAVGPNKMVVGAYPAGEAFAAGVAAGWSTTDVVFTAGAVGTQQNATVWYS